MSTCADRRLQAETLLHEVATELRGLPFEESTRSLHLRALALKRAIAGWADREPEDGELVAVCEEIGSLEREARRRARGGEPLRTPT
jgi:hypothetical protein